MPHTKPLTRYFLEIAYHGQGFAGFQVQRSALSIQAVLEEALGKLLHRHVQVVGSSRTDAGVHALGQMVHVDIPADTGLLQRIRGLNSLLPPSICLLGVYQAPANAHARYSATGRHYRYHIHWHKDPFCRNTSYLIPRSLHTEPMYSFAQQLLGQHDFGGFCKHPQQYASSTCHIHHAYWEPSPKGMVFHIGANRFLHSMVRRLVGAMLDVGQGLCTVAELLCQLHAPHKAGYSTFTAPAQGLFLASVIYPTGLLTPLWHIHEAQPGFTLP